MVPLSFPSPEGRGDHRVRTPQCTTVTEPFMLAWLVQEYLYVPTTAKVRVRLAAAPVSRSASKILARIVGPLTNVTLWWFAPVLVHTTALPVWTTISGRLKLLSLTSTAPDVGGADAISVNVTADWLPGKLALTVWIVEDPRESVVVATPPASVVLC